MVQVVQASFDNIGRPFDLYPNYTCVYSIPSNSIMDEYFVLPTLDEIRTNEAVHGVSLEIKEIAPYLRQATLRFPERAREYFYEGAYKLFFKSGKNPFPICIFNYRLQGYKGEMIAPNGGKLEVAYDVGEIGELQIYHSTFSPMVSAQLEAFTPAKEAIPVNQISKQCGLIGAGARRGYDYYFGRVQLVVVGVKPCLLLLYMNGTKNLEHKSYLNVRIRANSTN